MLYGAFDKFRVSLKVDILAKWLKNITFWNAGKRRLFTAVTQPLLSLHFQLLYKCHSKVKYNI